MLGTTIFRRSLVVFFTIVVSAGVRAQEQNIQVVTLITAGSGLIDSKRIAKVNLASQLAQKFAAQEKVRMVQLRTCPGISPDAIKDIMNELQKQNFVVALNLKSPDRQLCVPIEFAHFELTTAGRLAFILALIVLVPATPLCAPDSDLWRELLDALLAQQDWGSREANSRLLVHGPVLQEEIEHLTAKARGAGSGDVRDRHPPRSGAGITVAAISICH
jgi:biopolymer transport protein ExbD